MTPLLYLDDLTEGQCFLSGTLTVAAEEIKSFARQFDPQPFHLDETRAQDTFFGGLAASGWHTAALTMRLLVESLPIAGGLIGAGGEIRWPVATRPGDVLRVRSTVERITPSRSRPDRGTITLRSETLNQRDETAQILIATLVIPRRS